MTDNRKVTRDATNPRVACYDKLRVCMEQNLREYYTAHPERLMDLRSQQKIQMMRESLECILKILDDYTITERSGGVGQ